MGKCRIRQQSDIKSHRQREGEREEGERLLSKRSREGRRDAATTIVYCVGTRCSDRSLYAFRASDDDDDVTPPPLSLSLSPSLSSNILLRGFFQSIWVILHTAGSDTLTVGKTAARGVFPRPIPHKYGSNSIQIFDEVQM